ncbi:14839_t:CDS:2 [Funneliformis caledonium]|uniref:14839_t:CDS:1 n=1 Tax=Funneliformis caledonium TaxID=1117310 RepID=A0A9N8VZ37_9GLOM|nr:14839_t:CDS:2 [Funneliformis caledonium]
MHDSETTSDVSSDVNTLTLQDVTINFSDILDATTSDSFTMQFDNNECLQSQQLGRPDLNVNAMNSNYPLQPIQDDQADAMNRGGINYDIIHFGVCGAILLSIPYEAESVAGTFPVTDSWEFVFVQHKWLRQILERLLQKLMDTLLSPSTKSNFKLRGKYNPGLEEYGIAGYGIAWNHDFEAWHFNRHFFSQALLTPSFSQLAVSTTQKFYHELTSYWNQLDENRVTDLREWMTCFTTDNIYELMMNKRGYSMVSYLTESTGIETDVSKDNIKESLDFLEGFKSFKDGYLFYAFTNSFIRNLPVLKGVSSRFKNKLGDFFRLFSDIIVGHRERIHSIDESDDKLTNDIMTLMLKYDPGQDSSKTFNKKYNRPMNDKELIINMVLDKVRGEAQRVLGKNPRPITIEDCEKFSERFPYIDAVLKEVARMSSLAPLVDRINVEPEEFGGLKWPAYSHFIVNVVGIHNDQRYWKDPESFIPERHLNPDEDYNSKALIIFGGGTRYCPGRKLAMIEIRILTVLTFLQFDIELVDKVTPLGVKYAFFTQPDPLLIFIRLLWKSPIWKTPQSYKLFLNTLKKEKTLYNYSQMIRHLSFAPYRSRPQPLFSFSDMHLLSQKCFNITHLTFGHGEGTIIAPESVLLLIKKNPNLTSIKFLTLHFDDKWMSTALMPIINGNCSKLRELLFCEPSSTSQQVNQHQTVITTTKELSFNFLYSIGRKCKTVESLEIRTKISNTNALMIIKFFSHLTSLSIKTIEPEALKTLLHGFPNLKSFSFTFPQSISKEMTTEIAKEFPPLEHLSAILDLDTSSTFINTFATTQTKLKKLELFKCSNLTDSDLILLSEFCNQLESINLSFCQNLTDETISSLTQKNRQLKKIQLTNMPNLTNNGILFIVKNCPNLTSFIFNVVNYPGGYDGGGNVGDGQEQNDNQSRITSMAFIHLLQNCKRLIEFSGHFPKSTATKLLFELSRKRYFRGKGGCYKNLEILKIFPTGNACAVLKFKNLEELSIRLKQNQSLSANHLKRLSSHPKLREFELGDAVTVDAKNFYEAMLDPQQVTEKDVDENTNAQRNVKTFHDYYGIQFTYNPINAVASTSEVINKLNEAQTLHESLKFNQAKDIYQELADDYNNPHAQYQLGMYFYCSDYGVHALEHDNRLIHKPMNDIDLSKYTDFANDNGSIIESPTTESDTMDENDFLDENEAKQIAIDYFLKSAEQGYHNAFNILAIISEDSIRRHYSTGENVSHSLHLQNDDIMRYMKAAAEWKFTIENCVVYVNMYAKINYGSLLIKDSKNETDPYKRRELQSQGLRHLFEASSVRFRDANYNVIKEIMTGYHNLPTPDEDQESNTYLGIRNDEYVLKYYSDESEIESHEDFDNPSEDPSELEHDSRDQENISYSFGNSDCESIGSDNTDKI